MAWDDTAPTQSELNAPKWDAAPPSDAELVSAGAKSEPDWIDKAADYLPAIGGLAGGMVGLPGNLVAPGLSSIAGAGAGAAGGSALKNLIYEYRHPEDTGKTGALDDLKEGAVAAAGQAVGEKVLAPVLAPVAKLAQPVADYLSQKLGSFAAKTMGRATGMTGAQVLKSGNTSEQIGRYLLDNGIAGFGDTQGQIAKNAAAALESSGQDIGQALQGLDAQGASVSKSDIISNLRARAAQFAKDPSQLKVADGLNALADRLEAGAGGIDPITLTPQPQTMPLTAAENTKRGFQAGVNYNSEPYEHSVAEQAAQAYRGAVEDAATAVDPSAADMFTQAKQDYGMLAPIAEGTGKRAAALGQKQGSNLHALGGMGLGSVVGGYEGAKHGGTVGGLAGMAAGAFVGARALSSTAAAADWAAQAASAAPELAGKAVSSAIGQGAARSGADAPAAASDKIGEVVQSNPGALGQWAPALQAAASRGQTSLAATHAVLMQTSEAYREHVRTLFDSN